MYSVQTINDSSYYSDGHLTVKKDNFCSHAEFELSISNDSCSVTLVSLLDPKLLKHQLNDDDFAKISFLCTDDFIHPVYIVFKSSDAYKACCKVLDIIPDSDVIASCRSLVSTEM